MLNLFLDMLRLKRFCTFCAFRNIYRWNNILSGICFKIITAGGRGQRSRWNEDKFDHMLVACGILVPLLGIEPVPPALEAWSPNHRNVREFPISLFLKYTFAILHNECPIIKKFKWFFFFFFLKDTQGQGLTFFGCKGTQSLRGTPWALLLFSY